MDLKTKEIAFPKKQWVKFITDNRPDFKISASNPLHVELINKLASMGDSFVEWGSGSGYIAIQLANRNKDVQGLEMYSELIDIANETKAQEHLGSGKLSFVNNQDELIPADIVYSDGLLEHYSNDDIIELINQMKALAKKAVIINMPSMNYPWKQFGTEKFCKVKGQELAYWEKILEPFKKNLTELYYYGHNFFILGVIEGWMTKRQSNKKNSKQ